MDDLGDKLKAMLSDEKSFSQIMSLAKALGNGATPQDAPEQSEVTENSTPSGATSLLDMPQIKALFVDGANDRANLLKALRPYLREERKNKVDQITRAMSTVSALYSAKDLL